MKGGIKRGREKEKKHKKMMKGLVASDEKYVDDGVVKLGFEGGSECGVYEADGRTAHISLPYVRGHVRPRGDALPCVAVSGDAFNAWLWIEGEPGVEGMRIVTDYGDGEADDVKTVWDWNGRPRMIHMKHAKWQALRGNVAVKVTVEYWKNGVAGRAGMWLACRK